ncbi:MAG: hypothetical protein M3083_13005 [Actinomycetota bacterium]|nr:hypothetical protein [Actinomycetota bacterium]
MTPGSGALDLIATRRWLDRRTREGGKDDETEGLRQVRAAGAERVGRALGAGSGRLPPGQDAISWLRAAAEGGSSEAMVRLGGALVDHPDSFHEGEQWLRRAAEAGDPQGEFHFGRLMLFMGRDDDAEPWLDAAIEASPPLAMELVQELQFRGATELAGKWTRRLAEGGNPAAAIALSMQASEDGDHDEAQRWGEWAHQLGDQDAEVVLAVASTPSSVPPRWRRTLRGSGPTLRSRWAPASRRGETARIRAAPALCWIRRLRPFPKALPTDCGFSRTRAQGTRPSPRRRTSWHRRGRS